MVPLEKINHMKHLNGLKFLLIVMGFFMTVFPVKGNSSDTGTGVPLRWISAEAPEADTHVAFRGVFQSRGDSLEIRLSGSSWYVVWLDGEYFYEGPDRYHPDFPEYQTKKVALEEGKHVIAVHVHYEGVETRILKDIEPFLYAQILDSEGEIPVDWKCRELGGYAKALFRVSAQFGWVEWLDTRQQSPGWQESTFDDSEWGAPVPVTRAVGLFSPSGIANVKALPFEPETIAEGKLTEMYGYERDNPSARFFLRDLNPEKLPPQGVWKRYDLGRVRLARPKFVLDLPEGAVVEFAYSEQLRHGRVSPWINLSASDSYNLDHFVARGGVQEFFPLKPKGGRFVEIHILAPPSDVNFVEETFIERNYYKAQKGQFTCNDSLLNEIWQTGMETFLACAEDGLVDNPTRERGQWLGDFGIVGLQIGASGFADLRICRRGLMHSAQTAREDGMVAGLSPGGPAYLSSFAAQWVAACMNYRQVTGDTALLRELFPAAVKNMDAFRTHLTPQGISNDAGWAFIDWGYLPEAGRPDMALNLHYYLALQNMIQWAGFMGETGEVAGYRQLAEKMERIISDYFQKYRNEGAYDWETIGYHRVVLGLTASFFPPESKSGAVNYLKDHILNCFPNNPEAPRLSDPGANNKQLITPYFAHYAFDELIKNGEMDFVLDQYRKCWGWALEDGRTTWTEVFDPRWSHCHQWSGSPTWQLSNYALGLKPRFDKGPNHFEFTLQTGDLQQAQGKIPLRTGAVIDIRWEKKEGSIEYEMETPVPVTVHIPKGYEASRSGKMKVTGAAKLVVKDQ